MRNLVVACTVMVLAPVTLALAQQAPQPPEAAPNVPSPPFVTPDAPRSTDNVRLDVMVRADDGGKPRVVYQLSAVLGTGTRQRLTTNRDVLVRGGDDGPSPFANVHPIGLAVMATPQIQGRLVTLLVDMDLMLPPTGDPASGRPGTMKHTAAVSLESGKPLVVFTSETPGFGPKVSVELTATILGSGGASPRAARER